MGQATMLASAASDLHSTAGCYRAATGEIERTMGLISGIAYGLQQGRTGWSGKGNAAFSEAWQKSAGDASNVTTALAGAATAMSTLAATIDAQVPAIQRYESLRDDLNTTVGPARGPLAQELVGVQQDASTALSSISTQANSLAATLATELWAVVGVCSAGTVSVPLTGSSAQTANYWKGFLAGVIAMAAIEGENGQGVAGSESSDNACEPAGPQGPTSWQQILAALRQNFGTASGLAWSVGTGVFGGAANTTNNLLTSGLSKTTFNAFVGALLGGTFGPVTLTISQLLAPKIMRVCGISDQRTNNVVSLLASLFGGVVIGGAFEHYTLQPLLSQLGSSSHPTPTPGPAPTPAPQPGPPPTPPRTSTPVSTPEPAPTPGTSPSPAH